MVERYCRVLQDVAKAPDWRRAPQDIELMAKNKVLQVVFGPRPETDGKLGKEEPDNLDHAIQTSDRPRKS